MAYSQCFHACSLVSFALQLQKLRVQRLSYRLDLKKFGRYKTKKWYGPLSPWWVWWGSECACLWEMAKVWCVLSVMLCMFKFVTHYRHYCHILKSELHWTLSNASVNLVVEQITDNDRLVVLGIVQLCRVVCDSWSGWWRWHVRQWKSRRRSPTTDWLQSADCLAGLQLTCPMMESISARRAL